jgi:hypothetical protein
MDVKREKRVLFIIGKHLHVLVLVLSCVNLLMMMTEIFYDQSLNSIGSVILSLVGIYAFWLIHNNRPEGEKIMFIWLLLQTVEVAYLPYFKIDLSQAISLPLGFRFESYGSDRGIILTSLHVNFIVITLFKISLFRKKYMNYFRKQVIKPVDSDKIDRFVAHVVSIYSFGDDKCMLILDRLNGNKSYAIQVDKDDKLDNNKSSYLLCVIDTNKTDEESFKPYEFRDVCYVNISGYLSSKRDRERKRVVRR